MTNNTDLNDLLDFAGHVYLSPDNAALLASGQKPEPTRYSAAVQDYPGYTRDLDLMINQGVPPSRPAARVAFITETMTNIAAHPLAGAERGVQAIPGVAAALPLPRGKWYSRECLSA